MSQKAVDVVQPPAVPTPSVHKPADGSQGASPTTSLSSALKGFIETLHKQSERNTDIIDIFARALKELSRELKQERARREILERHVRDTEVRLEKLDRMVTALARQGWVH